MFIFVSLYVLQTSFFYFQNEMDGQWASLSKVDEKMCYYLMTMVHEVVFQKDSICTPWRPCEDPIEDRVVPFRYLDPHKMRMVPP